MVCIRIAKGIEYILFSSFLFFKTNELGEQFSIKSILLNVPLLRFRYHNSLIQNENFVFGEKGEVRGVRGADSYEGRRRHNLFT